MNTQPNLSYEYQVGGALEVDAPSYVVRQADDDLYNALKAGKFCYVLNSRQMGKSSLRVQTRRRLEKENVACASIDLTGIGSEDATSDKWYTGIILELKNSFSLEIDWKTWLREHKELNPVHRLREFIEQVLLRSVRQNIVIFVDEIDSVLALNFGIDDFFAFIRFCYNQRAEQPEYNRLTFALLGVATPPDLIQDKNRTPFNIGHAIELNGFQFQEAQLLAKGLASKTSNPETVLREVLAWTGGQPFLTQKLCQLVLDAESLILSGEEELWIENIVRSHIIENWESQDEPEHLRTIRNTILSNEQRAGYLLELYRQIWDAGEVAANNSEEEAKLQLSGLVVKQGGKLRVYNRIYREVFNQDWMERELGNLRPYSEAFRGWVASSYQDDWLLKGGVLKEAQAWANGKNLSYLDQQFLAACEKKEIEEQIAVADKEAQLERERKDREAAEARNQALTEANRKAKRLIQIGAAVLIVAVLGAVISEVLAENRVIEANSKVEDANSKVIKANSKVDEANSKVDAANQRATEAQKREQNAQTNEKRMQANAQQAEAREKELKQKATEAGVRLASAQQQAQRATEQSQQAQQALNQAQESAKAAELRVQALNQQREKTAQDLNRAKNELQSAQQKAIVAQANVEKAKQEEEQANKKLTEAETARQKVEADINNVSQLSQLGAQLQNQGLSSEANEAWKQASQVLNIEDDKPKQAMLFASISLAHQQLGQKFKEREEFGKEKEQWEEAKTAIDESLENLEQFPSTINLDDPKDWAIRVLVKQVQGSFLKERVNNQEALEAYTKAFYTLNAAWSKLPPVNDINTEIPIPQYLPQKQLILSANAIENLHRELMALLEKAGKDNSQIKESFKLHLLAELNFFMKSDNWKDADINTYTLIDLTGRTKDGFYYDNLSCRDLRTIDRLWVERSGGMFGFSVQKSILDQFASQPGRYDEGVNWDEVFKRIGWYRVGFSIYESGVFNPKKVHKGSLPAYYWQAETTPDDEGWTADEVISFFSRCD